LGRKLLLIFRINEQEKNMDIDIDINELKIAELEVLSEKILKEIKERKHKSEMLPVYKVNFFGNISVYKCPRAAIKSLEDLLVGTEDDPIESVWSAPSSDGIGTYLAMDTKMIPKVVYDEKSDWWLE